MKKLFFTLLILLFALPAYAQQCSEQLARLSPAMMGSTPVAAGCTDANPVGTCTGFLICQNFETATTGYDNSESWTEAPGSGGVIEAADTTATVIRGAQQLSIASGTASSYTRMNWGSTIQEFWLFMRVKVVTELNDDIPMAYVRNASESAIATLYARNNGTSMYFKWESGANGCNTATNLAEGTVYYLWLHVKNDGVYDMYVGTTETKPGAATCSGINGDTTGNYRILDLRSQHDGVAAITVMFDQVLVDNAIIGSVCP